jgi:precorrin-6Y C5,15-methyltransferase (decarboxylating)
MTVAAHEAIACCSLFIGAPRLLTMIEAQASQKFALTRTAQIIDCIRKQNQAAVIGVLFSGDVGFFSGAQALYPLLSNYQVEVITGVSSLTYFCAKVGVAWSELYWISGHGRQSNLIGAIQSHRKTFVLTGGECRVATVCRELCQRGLSHLQIIVGEELSYPQERITRGSAEQLAKMEFADLSVLLADNPHPLMPYHSIEDEAFCRGPVPMTKEEVRTLSLAKLNLAKDAVFWDIGAGTGSLAISGALMVPEGQAFAIEMKPDALELLSCNRERFGALNLTIVAGSAPEALKDLPVPDSVFIGGTSGRMQEILQCVLTKNAHARIVINAITLETLNEAVHCCKEFQLRDWSITQVMIAKSKPVGDYHLMLGENPVYILSGVGGGE